MYQLLIFDLDGTLYVDGEPIAGAVNALDALREQGYLLRFMTNTTTQTHTQLVQQLATMGFNIQPSELISAPEVARTYLRQQQQETQEPVRIWPVVSPAILADFDEFITDTVRPDFVVLGDIKQNWTLDLINQIFNVLQQGAILLALHKNKFWQLKDGLHVDIGLIVAGLEYVTGKHTQIMGKPSISFFDQVLASANCPPSQALIIGDDIDTDVGGAQRLGIHAILVETGKYRASYTRHSAIYPNAILPSVAALPDYLTARKVTRSG